jgi:hypothetical protein
MTQPSRIVFLIVFGAALALYVGTAAPSLTWAHSGADGGDLITAAITNGVPHPPGYPTYVTLGQLMARLPIGDVAYRFNLFSAVCMALAAGFTALSLLRLTPTLARASAPFRVPRFSKQGAVIIACLFFVTAPMVWGQATIAEVHALNACLVALIVYLITPIVFRGDDVSLRRLVLAAGLWGLALGNSLTVAALAPLMIVAWWRARNWARLWLPLMTFCLGLSVYALIPLRALQQPPINWGDATSLDRFLALVTAEMYRGYALSATAPDLLSRLIASAQLLVTQYGWLGVGLGAIGVYYALISPNRNWRWLALTLALYGAFALTYSAADSALYLIPVWMFGAWAIARGLLALTDYSLLISEKLLRSSLYARHLSLIILLLVLLLGSALTVLRNFSAMNLRADHAATEFARSVFSTAPAQAIVITANDGQTFALWYHRHVAGQRSDLAIVDRRLAGYGWYAAMLRAQGAAQGAAPILPDEETSSAWLDRVVELNAERAVCVVDPDSAQITCKRD